MSICRYYQFIIHLNVLTNNGVELGRIINDSEFHKTLLYNDNIEFI